MQKVTLTTCVVQYAPAAVPYYTLLDGILSPVYIVCILFIMLLVAPLYHKHFRPATLIDLRFLPPWRPTVTTGRGYLIPLDKLKPLFIKRRIIVNGVIIIIFICLYIIGHYVIQYI